MLYIHKTRRVFSSNKLVAISMVALLVLSTLIPIIRANMAYAANESFDSVANKTTTVGVSVAVNDLHVAGTGNAAINVSLFVAAGTLALGSTANVTATGNNTNSVQVAGNRNDVNASLATLAYTPTTSGTHTVQATIGGGDGDVYNTVNKHVYKVIPADPDDEDATISWADAKVAAEATTYGGVQGYLATITTQQEHDFVVQRINGDGWIGASDSAVEGAWRWVTGPEGLEASGAGRLFWNGNGSGSVVPGEFANWSATPTAEPNDSGGNEDCAQLRMSTGGRWNDLPCTTQLPYYIVEYGSDGNLPTVASKSFTVFAAGTSGIAQSALEIISTSSTGVLGNNSSIGSNPSISNDGRYVAFNSRASNLVASDTNNQEDVFVKDRNTGTTIRVSEDVNGVQGNNYSVRPYISGDGVYVYFVSMASNLVPGDTNGVADLFRKNISTGAIVRVSTSDSGVQGNGGVTTNSSIGISADNKFVMFVTFATNLITGQTNSGYGAYLKNTDTGAVTKVGGNGTSYPKLSADGAYAFFGQSAGLVPEDNNSFADLYRRNLSTLAYNVYTQKYDGTFYNGPTLGEVYPTTNGRYVGFSAQVPILEGIADDKISQSYVRDFDSGTSVLVSSSSAGVPGNGHSFTLSLSSSGRYVLMASDATNLGDDKNKTRDLYMKDTDTGNMTLLSLTDTDGAANSSVPVGTMTPDASIVIIGTYASNFKTGVNGLAGQLYARTATMSGGEAQGSFVLENEELPKMPTEQEENNAPNGGDGNNDGIRDSEQQNVTSSENEASGKYVTLELAEGCQTTDKRIIKESTSAPDAGYDYNQGLVRFSADCADNSTTVRVFHYGVPAANLTLRKFNPTTGAYFTIGGATITEQTIDGQIVAIATYTLIDNGPLDLDPAVGAISDPVGLGVLSVGSPNTGTKRTQLPLGLWQSIGVRHY